MLRPLAYGRLLQERRPQRECGARKTDAMPLGDLYCYGKWAVLNEELRNENEAPNPLHGPPSLGGECDSPLRPGKSLPMRCTPTQANEPEPKRELMMGMSLNISFDWGSLQLETQNAWYHLSPADVMASNAIGSLHTPQRSCIHHSRPCPSTRLSGEPFDGALS